MPFIGTKRNMQILGVVPLIKLQNNTHFKLQNNT